MDSLEINSWRELSTGKKPEGLAAALPAVELAAFAALVAVDLWLTFDRPWLQILVRILAVAVLIASFIRRGARWPAAPVGMAASRAWLEATAATLALGITVAAWSVAAAKPFDEPDLSLLVMPAPILGLWLLRRLVLGFIQQLVLHLLLWPMAREALGSGLPATVCVAVLFGLGHLPSVPFAIATAIAATLWLSLYRRSKRLAPLIVSHALLATLASVVPDRLFYDMKVGAPALENAAEQRSLGGEERQALLSVFASPRYFTYRRGTDRGYVEGLYRDILGRVAEGDEISRGVERLAAISRLGLAKGMLLSPELDDTTLWYRFIDDEPLVPGIEIAPDSDHAEFAGWYQAEGEWRWARDAAPAITFRIDREPERTYVLAISGGAAAPAAPAACQRLLSVDLELNGRIVGSAGFTDFIPRDYRFLIDPDHLAAGGDNTLRFLISGAPVFPQRGTNVIFLEGDSRALGFGLRRLRIAPLRLPSAAVIFTDDDYFLEGFSVAEERLRWTREPNARLTYPLPEIVPDACYTLRLRAGAFKRQEVNVSVNGRRVAEWTLTGLEPQIRSAGLDADLLRPGPNMVEFHLPGARSPEGDPRRLGLAVISVRIYPGKECP